MSQSLHVEDINKIKILATTAINSISTLIVYFLSILLLLFLVNIAYAMTKSYTMNTKNYQGVNSSAHMRGYSWESPEPSWSFSCDTAHFEYDICYLNRPTKVDPRNGVVSVVDPKDSTPPLSTWVHPYPRKGQLDPMKKVKEVTLTTVPLDEPCSVKHRSPILLFSTGGHIGNTFHDFNEGWIPLFVTVYELFRERDVILGIYNYKNWWLVKYAELLPYFTRHPIINLDEEKGVHCFPYGVVGLESHGVMEVDPVLFRENPRTLLDFHAVLAQAYKPYRESSSQILPTFSSISKPKLAFVVRRGTRKVINEKDVVRLAETLGFEVIAIKIESTTPMREIYRLINSSHAMMGIHGSGLTHFLFLRPGAVFIQIVPFNCGWLADMCFGKAAQRLGLNYIAYEIGFNESSLRTDKFAREATLGWFDPVSAMMENINIWSKYMRQDVEIDLSRFRRYLEKAYEKARIFMKNNA